MGDRRMRTDDRRSREVEVAAVCGEERRSGDERRRGDRRAGHRLELELWFEEVEGDAAYLRCAANVGEGGVYFDHAVPHPVGTTLTLSFSLPGQPQPLRARGEVVSTAHGVAADVGMGVRFTGFEEDGELRLGRFIAAQADSPGADSPGDGHDSSGDDGAR